MGFLDDLKGVAGSLLGGAGAQSPVARSVLELLGQSGGLAGLVQSFQKGGLGDVVNSWVGTGRNLPVSAQQIQQVLGPQVARLAAQHGMAPEAVAGVLSQVLPGLVDHVTPDGKLPSADSLQQGLSALRSKLGI